MLVWDVIPKHPSLLTHRITTCILAGTWRCVTKYAVRIIETTGSSQGHGDTVPSSLAERQAVTIERETEMIRGLIARLAAAGMCLLALQATPSAAQGTAPTSGVSTTTSSAPPPVVDYARYPLYRQSVLSPDGHHLAALAPIRNRMNIVVIDLKTKVSKVLTSIERYDALNLRWVGSDHLVFTMGTLNTPSGSEENDGGGLFMVSRDGSDSRGLSPTIREIVEGDGRHSFWYPRTQILGMVPGSSKELLVSEYRRTKDGADVYRLDVTTGRRELVTADRPANTYRYVLDLNMVPRVAVSGEYWDTDKRVVWYRDSETAPWRELFSNERGEFVSDGGTSQVTPVAFDDDNENLLVTSTAGRETRGLFRYNVKSRQRGDLLAAHPKFDVDSIVRDPDTRKVIGLRVEAEQEMVAWFDETTAQRQAVIDKALPGRVNMIASARDRHVIYSYDDVSSPAYYLYDATTRRLEKLLDTMPWIKPGHLVPMRPFVLKTRDGLEIPSYYFLPAGAKPGDKLPTVVHIHGGPSVRADSWGTLWDGGFGVAEAQFLASRGYAVVLPNFRVTPGLGTKIYLAGRGTIGRKMSEDHEDAAHWAVAQGFADPKRMCITGASYGGYATLQALVKTPDLFKCGIAGLSVSDLERQLTSTYGDTYTSRTAQAFWRNFLIGETRQPGTARAMSPVHHADKVKAPLLFYAGSADRRTPLEQTTGMVDALKKAGHNPEVIVKLEEGHGFAVLDNRVELWERMTSFLEKHIGKGASPR